MAAAWLWWTPARWSGGGHRGWQTAPGFGYPYRFSSRSRASATSAAPLGLAWTPGALEPMTVAHRRPRMVSTRALEATR
eukprot:scaffold6068_cov119-Isochrysis_galbana.AAC.12